MTTIFIGYYVELGKNQGKPVVRHLDEPIQLPTKYLLGLVKGRIMIGVRGNRLLFRENLPTGGYCDSSRIFPQANISGLEHIAIIADKDHPVTLRVDSGKTYEFKLQTT